MASLDLFLDEDIKRLERIKQLLKEIKELDINFSLSNVIEINNNTKLIFRYNCMLKKPDIRKIEENLTNKLRCQCVLINKDTHLYKAIQKSNK